MITQLTFVLLVCVALVAARDLRSGYVIQSVNLTFGVDNTNPPGCICESDETMLGAAECTSTDNQKLSASFADPFVPPTNERWMVWSVNATIWGRFNCVNDSDGANLLLFLGQAVIGFTSNDTATPLAPGCECPACAVPFELRSDPGVVDDLTGWPGFVYYDQTGTNTVLLLTYTGRACYSMVNLQLGYLPAPPVVTAVSPLLGPVTGQTVITLTGTGFRPVDQQNVLCYFGDQTPIVATYVSASEVQCQTGEGTGDVPLNLAVLQDGNRYLISQDGQHTPFNVRFVFYETPTITSISPIYGSPTGSTNVTITGVGFISSDWLNCRFGTDSYPQKGWGQVIVQVSLNAQQWADTGAVFLYQDVPPQPINFTWFIIATAAVFTVAVLSCVSAVIYMSLSSAAAMSQETKEVVPSIQGLDESAPLIAKSPVKPPRDVEVAHTDLRIVERIGRGSHGEVYRGYWCGTLVAIKKLNAASLTPELENDLKREAKIMEQMRHPNVLQFFSACTVPPNICIVMEYMPRGSLYKVIHEEGVVFNLEMLRGILIDSARGMNYLHKSAPPILHRDLKSHNILLDEHYKAKVCDFGLSKILESGDNRTMTACGTPCWAAPEILRNQRYTTKADVFSFAIVMWECYAREAPYANMPPFQVVFAVGTQGLRPEVPQDCPSRVAELMQMCWAESPDLRPSFEDLLQLLTDMTGPPDWTKRKIRAPQLDTV